ncbi:hypothetical protein ACFQI7_28110 [Paenibacillus allorhizosphaerae]|uniref:MotA/TolQ/ExbB proton channel domain-containing protein n=1 Tax=Paenibacillus allorhizosphaerae TaxID=2849866 RepID=A0ABN7TQK8_9BACL|nr:hypothetical protein [Paenibacillus allorhizosphaerae]CAG7651535.1 hypothetical protein PAECIP111802_04988 [Paenibacillus allorhizosphaerae]
MSKQSTRSNLIQELYQLQERSSLYNLVLKPAAKIKIITISILAGIVVFFLFSFGFGNNPLWQKTVVLSSLGLILILWSRTIWVCNNYVKEKFGAKYKKFMNYTIFDRIYEVQKDFLREYRLDQMEDAFKNIFRIPIDQDHIQSVIEIIRIEKNRVKDMRWLPISLSAILSFPLWSEYIGFRFNLLLASSGTITDTNKSFLVAMDGLSMIWNSLLLGSVVLLVSTLIIRTILHHLTLTRYMKLNELEETLLLMMIYIPENSANDSKTTDQNTQRRR